MEVLVEKAYEKGGFNGTWLYAENGVIVSKGAFGWRDAENTLPMEEDTIFEMASVTKMFTAAAVMILVREGQLRLDDEYTIIFPEFPYKGVTIRHLLTHTSGIPIITSRNSSPPFWKTKKGSFPAARSSTITPAPI